MFKLLFKPYKQLRENWLLMQSRIIVSATIPVVV